ncbi:MAG: DUF1456 family protein [Cytophagales bacterium]|nr:DUF1456 family protein [Cytophagales bacterium]
MTNNDILRSLRYTFDFNDLKMIQLFEMGGLKVDRAQVSDWLKQDHDPEFKAIVDHQLAAFLTGLIVDTRDKKEGEEPKAEKKLNNNIIFRKLKIALNYKDEDILAIFDLVKFRLGKHELSAFFRKPDADQYRPCGDQVLRNFLYGLRLKFRPEN